MTCRLRWIVNARTGCFHAADAVARRLPSADASVGETLAAPVAAVEDLLAPMGVAADAFWRSAVPLSAAIEDNHRLAKEVLRREYVTIDEAISLRLSDALSAVESAARAVWPRLEEELQLRERPLREQWEARGPGFLRRLSHLADSSAAPPEAGVVLVPPYLGGGGEAHPEFGLVRLEAVLANAWMELPEALRLGWLIAQLGKADAATPDAHRRMVIGLARLPMALEAGEYVEWTRADRRTLEAALVAWRPPLPDGADPAEIANLLDSWRRRSMEASLSWEEALSELDAQL